MPTPWWKTLVLRDEVLGVEGNVDDLQTSLFRVAHASRDEAVPYADASYYGSITEPTPSLVEFLASIAVRLGGGTDFRRGHALIHLDQGMGGGKSHALVGLYHMASSPQRFFGTDIGSAVWRRTREILDGKEVHLRDVRTVALCADHMTPLAPDQDVDGPGQTLWERFLWRLVDRDFSIYQQYRKRQDQSGITEALRLAGRPVLILVDEIMDYIRQLDDQRFREHRNQDLAFIRALFDAVNDVPHVSLVVVLISSDRDPALYGDFAQAFREEFQANITRNGVTMAVSDAGDFGAIVRRRIFVNPPPPETLNAIAEAYLRVRTPAWRTQVFDKLMTWTDISWRDQVRRYYPFHPEVFRLVEGVWAHLAGYQRVRSTFSLFARSAYVWYRRAEKGEWVPELIGLGDIPLDDGDTREHLLKSGVVESNQLAANFRQVITTDIAAPDDRSGLAAAMDRGWAREGWHKANPRAAQRMATALFLYSLAPRSGILGATDAEVRAAAYVPSDIFTAQDSETVFNHITDPEAGLGSLDIVSGGTSRLRRFLMTTRQTLRMLFRAQRAAAAEDPEREARAWAVACGELTRDKGPFQRAEAVRDEPDPATGAYQTSVALFTGIDRPETRLVALDPRRWLLLNGKDDETRRDIAMLFGLGSSPLAVNYAATLVVVCANRYQWTSQALNKAKEALAWERVADIPSVRADMTLAQEVTRNVEDAKKQLARAVRKAFQHFAVLVRDADDSLVVRHHKFESDDRTSLSGSDVWKALVESSRAANSLGIESFLTLIASRLPRTLGDLALEFTTNAKYPMVPDPLQALRVVIYECLRTGRLELIGRDESRLPTPESPENVAVKSPEQWLHFPQPKPAKPVESAGLRANEDSALPGLPESEQVKSEQDQPSDLMSSPKRATFTVRLLAGTDGSNRDAIVHFLGLLKNGAQDGLLEGIDLSLKLDGDMESLEALERAGKRIQGARPRIEALP